MNSDKNNSGSYSPLRYHELLDAFQETIDTHYSEQTIDVYRTAMTNPPTDADLVPQRYRHADAENIKELLIEYTEEDIAELSEQEKKDEVSSNAISVNTTLEKSLSSVKRTFRTVMKNHPESVADFKKNRGSYVVRFHVTPEIGVISRPKNGHQNLLLREGVKISDVWDTDFEPYSFKYDDETDNT